MHPWLEEYYPTPATEIPHLEDNMKKVLVIGHGRAGKDEFCEWLTRNVTDLRFTGSTSIFLHKYVYAEMVKDDPTLTMEQCYTDRHANRMIWFGVGHDVRNVDSLFLIKEALKVGNLVAGLRDIREIRELDGLFDHIVWIERDVVRDPTMEYTLSDVAEILSRGNRNVTLDVIINNGGIEKLHDLARHWATSRGFWFLLPEPEGE